MKKLLALIFALVMVLSLVACGDTAAPSTDDAAGGDTDSDFKLTLAAMAFALAAWFITMYFVFK